MNKKTFIVLYFTLFYAIIEDIFANYETIDGFIKCIDKGLYKTCIFKNIYYINKQWIIYSNYYGHFNYCLNAYAKKLGECWKVNIHLPQNYKKGIFNSIKIFNGISIPFQLTYTVNYGHALWDDLYSVYTSIVKSGYPNDSFNLIFNKHYRRTAFLDDIIFTLQKFSKGKNIYLNQYDNSTILFKKLIVGSSHQCQRCVTVDYSLKYSRKYNITKLIRDRMYKVFNVKPSFSYPIEGVIIHNKRYSIYEYNVLKRVIRYYQNMKDSYIKLYYIDYRNYSTFFKQLKLMSRVHIYISGPGTGLLNFPFIADPGVIIHLGHIHFGCPQYLEQYMLEGSPHYKAIYYSPELRILKLNYSYIINLINIARNYIINNKLPYSNKEENLNEIGKLYVKICQKYKKICNKLIHNYNWAYGKCRGIWAENVIFFPSLYTKIPELKNIVTSYNNAYNLGCKIGINYSKQKQCIT